MDHSALGLVKRIEYFIEDSFKMEYLKGKDIIIVDFLSRYCNNDTGSFVDIIPTSFCDLWYKGNERMDMIMPMKHWKFLVRQVYGSTWGIIKEAKLEVPLMYLWKGDQKDQNRM